ncbi:nucleotide exchange factor GrpE [Nakamurella sp. A5-74]|uniref:Protein GrpE n=1 Tax=Nakamurella sp. A5-74 TaxID=3158264 RepID=A0AAU8DR67_9ACTN
MTGSEPDNESGADKPFQFRDRRRIDPQTGAVRDPAAATAAAGSAGPFPAAGDPGDPAQAAQPLDVTQDDDRVTLAQLEAAELKGDLQRVSAEYANYRKRVDRDREQVVLAAKSAVVTDFLAVLDDVDRAEAHGDLTGAFKTVADKLGGILGKLGVERVGATGEKFDPALHEAVQFATSDEVTEQTVTGVLRVGYSISGRLVRPAVVVVTGPEHEPDGTGDIDSVTVEQVDPA